MTVHVELTVPGRADFLSLVRLHVGAVAARVDMTIDEIEDLLLAIDELCIPLVDDTTDADIRLTVATAWDDESVEVRCRVIAEHELGDGLGAPGLPSTLSNRILDALVDEHGVSVTDSGSESWLRKRRTRPQLP